MDEHEIARRSDVVDELYTMLDRGLGKKDASRLVELIEELVELRVAELKRELEQD